MQFRLTAHLLLFLFTAVSIVLLLPACSQTGFQYLEPEYNGRREFSTSLLVMPLNSVFIDSANIEDPANLMFLAKPRFTWGELNYFHNYMGSSLSELTTARVHGIDPYFRPENLTLSYTALHDSNGSEIRIFCPDSGRIKFNDSFPDYVLFFEDLIFNKDYQESMNNIGNGTNKNYSLNTGLEYLLWDNRSQRVVGFGQFAKYINLLNYPKKDTYIELFEDWARDIISFSPFVAKY